MERGELMNECSSDKKCHIAFFASIAANIFFVAFALGRLGPHDMFPQPMEHGGPFHAEMRPGLPPPMFGPGDLFEPDEMRADEARMRKDFDEMDALRKTFATQLQAGPVSKESVLKHFADIDQVMDGIKKEAQGHVADKISSMSEDERKHFAQTLLDRGKEPFGEERHKSR